MTVIASQLDAASNQRLREALPSHRIIDLAPGEFAAAEGADVAVLRPINVRGQRIDTSPAGWPWSLKWVQLVSSGIDFYPDWVFQGPPVTSGRGSNAVAVAEYALATLFAAAKSLPQTFVRDAQWSFTALKPIEGATLGILGLGSIGQVLAHKANALGMRVIAFGRPGHPLPEVPGVEAVASLEQLFASADHLIIAAPLTAATRGLIDRQVLAHARPGLHLVNIARGGLLDQTALLDALNDGLIGRASLDVTEPEPLPDDHPLYRHPNVFITPHTSAISTQGLDGFIAGFLDNVRRFDQGEPLANLIDFQRGY